MHIRGCVSKDITTAQHSRALREWVMTTNPTRPLLTTTYAPNPLDPQPRMRIRGLICIRMCIRFR